MAKAKLVEELKSYFNKKGRFLSYKEYVEAGDGPVRVQLIKREIGPWGRLERMIGEVTPLPVVVPKPAAKEVKK